MNNSAARSDPANTPSPEELSRAASVYAEHQDVIENVLRKVKGWTLIDTLELASDFRAHHLPIALRSYRPEGGEIEGWLYSVFLNFTKKRFHELHKRANRESLLVEAENLTYHSEDSNHRAAAADAVIRAVQTLDETSYAIIRAYFGSAKGSLRKAAQIVDSTRYSVEKDLYHAIDLVVQATDSESIGEKDKLISSMLFGQRLELSQVVHSCGIDQDEVKERIRDLVKIYSQAFQELFEPSPPPESQDAQNQ